jgi:hypothetical protein
MSDATDLIAERQVLGIALATPDQAAAAFAALGPDCFTDARHALIAAVLTDRYARGIPIEPQGVLRACVERSGTDDAARQVGQLVTSLVGQAGPAGALAYYVERVGSLATVRRVHVQATRFRQQLEGAAATDDDDLFRTAVASMRDACEDAMVTFKAQPPEPPMSLADLLAGTDEYDWLVPGLLERTDRVVITGHEGLGKSTVSAQAAATVAAGLHPFSAEPLPRRSGGYRVLVVDCENSRRQLRRRFRGIARQMEDLTADAGIDPPDWSHSLRFVIRPEGVSLTEPRELARMEQAVAATAPDLLVIGPMYRLSKVDVRDEQAAKELTDAIDLLRIRHQLAVFAETHAGHGKDGSGSRQLRPLGSSLFLRWPEFGYGLRPHSSVADEEHPSLVEVGAWRGSRDERHWPKLLRHGKRLPWEPANDDYWDQPLLRGVS